MMQHASAEINLFPVVARTRALRNRRMNPLTKDFLTVLALTDDRRQSCLAPDLRAGGRLRSHPHELFRHSTSRASGKRARALTKLCLLSTVMIKSRNR